MADKKRSSRSDDDPPELEGAVVGERYKLIRPLGAGSFACVYLAEDLYCEEGPENDLKRYVAVKLEHVRARYPMLKYENRLYQRLEGGTGIPRVKYFGQAADHKCLVMDLQGPTLEDVFNMCERQLSIKSVCLLADQLFSRCEFIHNKCFIVRDIKPANFLTGIEERGQAGLVFAIDFGLAKKFMSASTGEHIPFRDKKPLTGTARYASINAHKGYEQSRRDDLESVCYCLIYFSRNGKLPWMGLPAPTKEAKYARICARKEETLTEDLMQDCPAPLRAALGESLDYARNLEFEEEPDYTALRKRFRDLYRKQGYGDPDAPAVFDWMPEADDDTSTEISGAAVPASRDTQVSMDTGPGDQSDARTLHKAKGPKKLVDLTKSMETYGDKPEDLPDDMKTHHGDTKKGGGGCVIL